MDRWISTRRKWCPVMGRSTLNFSPWSCQKAPIALTAIEEDEMMMPSTLWVSGISIVPGGCVDHPTRDGWTGSYTGQFGPDHAEKHRQMGLDGHFCHSDNAPQDGDSLGAAEAAHSRRHPAPNTGPCHSPPPVFAVSNPATEAEEDDPGWSTSETSSSQFTTWAQDPT